MAQQVHTVSLPDIGEGVVEGEVIQWLKKEGDALAQDEPVVMVMTDKATVELPAPVPGTLKKQHVNEGNIAKVGKPLYDIETTVAVPSIKRAESCSGVLSPKQVPSSPMRETRPPSTQVSEHRSSSGKQPLAIPKVRHLAKEMNIDLSMLKGSGKEGRITVEDLQAHHAESERLCAIQPIERQKDDEEQSWIGIRHMMAEKMAESKHIVPHFSFLESTDVSCLMQLKESFQRQGAKDQIQVSFVPFFVRAASLCMAQFPWMNSSIDPDASHLIQHKHHHIGIAMSSPQGLIVPVLKSVELLSLEQIIRAYVDIKQRAQHHQLRPEEMKGATFTLSNFGSLGGHGQWATPIINYPEVAILATAPIRKEPVVVNDQLAIRDVLHCSWSFDHRVIDGHLATQIASYFCTLLKEPARLL